jgi:choline dehydrogenase
MGFGKTIVNPNFAWGYRTEPDRGIADRSLAWTGGKVLGGSGSINGLVFIRGAAADYDEWERLGARGWSYQDVLPYFRMMESSTAGDDECHGRNGPITITTNKRPSSTAKAFVAGCENLQFARNDDFNSGRIDDVGFVPINVDGRWRHSTASAYLKPHLHRPNLKLLTRTTVHRIIFEGPPAGLELSVCRNGVGDPEREIAFNSGLYGWNKDRARDMAPMGTYQTFATGGVPCGAL